jgi:receptor protein-tyrosine kinase
MMLGTVGRTGHELEADRSDHGAASAPRGVSLVDISAVPGEKLIVVHEPWDPRCETIRALRTELLLRRESADSADVIALLSACPREGRSLLAADLAIAVAQTGCPTLLVDADFRRPQQHVLFGTHNRTGLAQAIAAGKPPRLRPVHGLPDLSLLTAGEIPGDPLEALSSRNFKMLLEEWRQQFRFVVIDTAPVAEFSDALVVANVVGRVLVLSRAKHTPYREMQSLLRRLAATRSEVLGAVISHF